MVSLVHFLALCLLLSLVDAFRVGPITRLTRHMRHSPTTTLRAQAGPFDSMLAGFEDMVKSAQQAMDVMIAPKSSNGLEKRRAKKGAVFEGDGEIAAAVALLRQASETRQEDSEAVLSSMQVWQALAKAMLTLACR